MTVNNLLKALRRLTPKVRFDSYKAAFDSKMERCKECNKVYFCYQGLCHTCFLGKYREVSRIKND